MGRDLARITCLWVLMPTWRWRLEDSTDRGFEDALSWIRKLEKQGWLQQSLLVCRGSMCPSGTRAGGTEAGL